MTTQGQAAAAPGPVARLARRGVVEVGGPDAERFLNDLVTADVMPAGPGRAVYGGLLSPQGKILFDFIAFRDADAFLFDLPRDKVADFARRLGFYRLRAKVAVAERPELAVLAGWGDAPPPAGIAADDPRLAALGWRALDDAGFPAGAAEADYDAHRIALGVPEGGIDFAFGDTFPHDADMDQLHGIDFAKGCYVGQEVVSRIEHRHTARRRMVMATAAAPVAQGAEIVANGRPIGTLGSGAGTAGLALVRLDRARDAMDAGAAITAAGVPLTLAIPPWATFTWPASGVGEP